jgi:ankyrin repeat protein/nucleoside phosphorylase
MPKRSRPRIEDFAIGWICALPLELEAARNVLDQEYEPIGELNNYILGRIGDHNVTIACLSAGRYGTNSAASTATDMVNKFHGLKFGLIVGIAGGIPRYSTDVSQGSGDQPIHLGDVVISYPKDCRAGVVQYDSGKTGPGGRQSLNGSLNGPHETLLKAVSIMRSSIDSGKITVQVQVFSDGRSTTLPRPLSPDVLYDTSYDHSGGPTCAQCSDDMIIRRSSRPTHNICIHYGLVGSGNQVMKDATTRDRLYEELGILCFEMEAAGVMNFLPCLVLRGICDYADSHKLKTWQPFAAAAAASCARAVLSYVPTRSKTQDYMSAVASPCSMSIDKIGIDQLRGGDPTALWKGYSLSEDQKSRYLESLAFEQMESRRSTITAAHEKTCRWLLDDSGFRDWLSGDNFSHHHGFYWIKGKPAAGKSTIVKFVLNQLKKKHDSTIISFFFHARGGDLEKTAVGMYRSLLHQLMTNLPHLRDVLSLRQPTHSEDGTFSWDIETLKTLFSNAVEKLGQKTLICFIDALDECHDDEVREMVVFFEHLGNLPNAAQLHICFSSRHYPQITIQHSMELVLEENQGHHEDIEKYIHSKLNKLGHSKQADEIRTEILNRSSGIFLWVILVIKILKEDVDRGRVHSLKKRLGEIPDGLDDIFNDILSRDSRNLNDLVLCLQWLCFARQPLKPEELYHAILIGTEPESVTPIDTEQINQSVQNSFILDCSKGLAEIRKVKAPTVQFIHESVRDYLLKAGGLQRLSGLTENLYGSCHDQLKCCCQKYLIVAQDLSPGILISTLTAEEAIKSFPFLKYATRQLLYHSDVAEQNGISQTDFLDRFSPKSWIPWTNLFERHAVRHYTKSVTRIYIFANEGFSSLVQLQLKSLESIDFDAERYGHPLIAALVNTDQKTVEALLEADIWHSPKANAKLGTDSQTRDTTVRTVLERKLPGLGKQNLFAWTLRNNKAEVAKMILDMSIGFDFSDDGKKSNPLIQAALKNHVEVLTLVLDTKHNNSTMADLDLRSVGANVNAQGGYYGNALEASSARGHLEVVKLLVDKGADVNAQGGHYGNALYASSARGHLEVVKLLADKGADVNAQGGYYGNALQASSAHGHVEVVKLLADKGADVNAQGGDYGNALQASSARGHVEVVKLLVDKGADVNAQGGHYGNALQASSANGHVEVVKLLVDKGADVNAQGGHYGNALYASSARGHVEVVKLLLDKGADVNAQGGSNGSALQAASAHGNLEVVRLLEDKGANFHVRG